MTPTSLHALVIDRHFGELSPEVAELLELHLATDTESQAEAQRILRALAVTQKTVLQHPELARVAWADKPAMASTAVTPRRAMFFSPAWLARAAAVLLLAALTGAGGFLAGRSSSAASEVAMAGPQGAEASADTARKESPWARYRTTYDPAGQGMQVVRVDTIRILERSLP